MSGITQGHFAIIKTNGILNFNGSNTGGTATISGGTLCLDSASVVSINCNIYFDYGFLKVALASQLGSVKCGTAGSSPPLIASSTLTLGGDSSSKTRSLNLDGVTLNDSVIVNANGILELTNGSSLTSTLSVSGGKVNMIDSTVSGPISVTSGSVTVSGISSSLSWSGSSFTGGTVTFSSCSGASDMPQPDGSSIYNSGIGNWSATKAPVLQVSSSAIGLTSDKTIKHSSVQFSGNNTITGGQTLRFDPSFVYFDNNTTNNVTGNVTLTGCNNVLLYDYIAARGTESYTGTTYTPSTSYLTLTGSGTYTASLSSDDVILIGYYDTTEGCGADYTIDYAQINNPSPLISAGGLTVDGSAASNSNSPIFLKVRLKPGTNQINSPTGSPEGAFSPLSAPFTDQSGNTVVFSQTTSATGITLTTTIGGAGPPNDASTVSATYNNLYANNMPFYQWVTGLCAPPPPVNLPPLSFSSTTSSMNDTIIDSIQVNQGSSSQPTNADDSFHAVMANVVAFNNPSSSPVEYVMKKLMEHGPLNFGTNQYRVWVQPFYSSGRTKTIDNNVGSNDRNLGMLVGSQMISKTYGTLGVYVGNGFGGSKCFDNSSSSQETSKIIGIYHSKDLNENWRYDLIAGYIGKKTKTNRLERSTGLTALSNMRSSATSFTAEGSYKHQFNDQFSIRPNLGFNRLQERTPLHQEQNARQNITYGKKKVISNQWYGGIGLRYTWLTGDEDDPCKCKLTAVYEYGHNFNTNLQKTNVVQMGNTSLGQTVTSTGPGKNTSYVMVYASAQTTENLKFLAGYKGSFQKKRVNNGFALKVEYRF